MTRDNVVKSHVSTFSGANGGNCVEVALLDDGRIRLTETKDPESSIFTDEGSIDAFIRGAKHGEFDWVLEDRPQGLLRRSVRYVLDALASKRR